MTQLAHKDEYKIQLAHKKIVLNVALYWFMLYSLGSHDFMTQK
jgi:hypothetical protein